MTPVSSLSLFPLHLDLLPPVPTLSLMNERGEVILSLHVPDTAELRRWLLGFGSAALVLEPPDLREAIRAEAEGLLRAMEVEEFLADQLPRLATPPLEAGCAAFGCCDLPCHTSGVK